MPSCQISLYPLGTEDLGQPIEAALKELDTLGIQYEMGTMSTVIYGSEEQVFSSLRNMYAAVSDRPVVMSVTISNACPIPRKK